MRKLLIAYGLLWTFLYCLHGLYLGAGLHGNVFNALHTAANRGDLVTFWSTLSQWNTVQAVHSHGMGFAILVLLVAVVWDDIYLPAAVKTCLGAIWMIGVTVHSVANIFTFIPGIVFGDFVIMTGVAVSFIGVARGLPLIKD